MSKAPVQTKLAIVDDHNLFRKGLIKLISLGDKDNRYKILFEAANGSNMKEKLSGDELPDIVLMDIDMPDTDGYEAVEWIRKFHSGINILVISMLAYEEKAVIRMLRLGVKGYLSKDIEVNDMHMALEAISGKGYFFPEIVTGVMADIIGNNNHTDIEGRSAGKVGESLLDELNNNEREFLKLACTDLTYQQIAEKMNLSVKSVDRYRHILFTRFEVKNRVTLALFAVKIGLVNV